MQARAEQRLDRRGVFPDNRELRLWAEEGLGPDSTDAGAETVTQLVRRGGVDEGRERRGGVVLPGLGARSMPGTATVESGVAAIETRVMASPLK